MSIKSYKNMTTMLPKSTANFKLHIPEDFYQKVQYLCTRISEVEWSGVLFYTITGSLDKGDVVVECKDILPLDKGTSSYTEFTSDERFAEFMMAKSEVIGEEVFEWQQGLIHSHNSMDVFFSGTDQSELLESCHIYNQYLSLICNNKMEFCAKIARSSVFNLEIEDAEFIGLSTSGEKEVVKKKSLTFTEKSVDVFDADIEVSFSKEAMDSLFIDFTNRIMKPVVQKYNQHFSRVGYNNSFLSTDEDDWFPSTPTQKSQRTFQPKVKAKKTQAEDLEEKRIAKIKEFICKFFTVNEYIEGVENDPSDVMLETICSFLEGFRIDPTEAALDFIANCRTYCADAKINYKKVLTQVEKFIEENTTVYNEYMTELSKEILKIVK